MSKINELFNNELNLINVGAKSFLDDYTLQNISYVDIDWQPPAGGDVELIEAIDTLMKHEGLIKKANQEVIKRINKSKAKLVGVKRAVDVIPGMDNDTVLHAGPPIEWKDMAGPLKGAIIGALIYENKAKDQSEAEALAESGKIKFGSCHEHDTVGPMAGVVSPSMPVHVIENSVYGNKAYCTINEGLGKVLRYGANNSEVIERLEWMEKVFAPVLGEALERSEGIDLKNIVSQSVHMGDECHNRNKASTSLFLKEIIPSLLLTNFSLNQIKEVVDFIRGNDHYFLNLSMPMCKVSLDAASGIENSTIVTAMSRNGTEFGIRISGLGDQWYTAPANKVKGLLFPGYTEDDAALDIGDSTITETMGLGGFTMAAAPAIVKFVGGNVSDAIEFSEKMYQITEGENSLFTIPNLDFKGSALGIDIIKVVEKNQLPIINTGIAHKVAGVGQIGAGLVKPPKDCFRKAILDLQSKIGGSHE